MVNYYYFLCVFILMTYILMDDNNDPARGGMEKRGDDTKHLFRCIAPILRQNSNRKMKIVEPRAQLW
jgi:hypothetical protein